MEFFDFSSQQSIVIGTVGIMFTYSAVILLVGVSLFNLLYPIHLLSKVGTPVPTIGSSCVHCPQMMINLSGSESVKIH